MVRLWKQKLEKFTVDYTIPWPISANVNCPSYPVKYAVQKWNSLLIKHLFNNDYKNYQVHGEADITGICLRLLEAFGGVSCASNVVCSSRPILIYYNSYMAARLGGIKDEKSSWGSEMDNTFSFYFPKTQSHVWISTCIESGLSNCR